MMDRASYLKLIAQLDELVELFQQHPDPLTQERMVALLSGLDALHRAGLRLLVDGLRAEGGQALVNRLAADPVVEILLGLYDLVPLDLPEETQPHRSGGFVPLDEVTLLQGEIDGSGITGGGGRDGR